MTDSEDMKNPVFPVIIAVLLFLALLSGCSAPLPTGGSRPAGGTTGPAGSDSVYLTMHDQSAKELLGMMRVVNSRFPTAAVNSGQVYSPATLRQAALDMKNAADKYQSSLLALKDFQNTETEIKRNEYLGYITGLSAAGSSIAEAAAAESTGQYALAMNYAERAETRLERIDAIPDPASAHEIQVMRVQLDDYARIMREKLTE
ncbi:MAG: hypothetical protein LUQ61_02145 [Methanoregulaceae archaeon]|nr:hypothetical protein [Methanoregulaceae archaeon]